MSDHDHNAPVDAWHDHSAEAPAQEAHGEANPLGIFIVGGGGFLITVVLIVLVAIYFNQSTRNVKVQLQERVALDGEYLELKARAKSELEGGYEWVDVQAPGVISLPIETATELTANMYAETAN